MVGRVPVFSASSADGACETSGPPAFQSGRRAGDQGIFAGWRWTGERLLVDNDRWGVQPLFWSSSAEAIHVSPSIDALLEAGVQARIDDAAMAVFLRTGFFVGEDTPFAAIRALPAAASLTWTPGGVSVASGWSYPRTASIDREKALDGFADCFTAAVQRCLRSAVAPSAVLLSGGHDSRHILLAMHELDELPDCCVTVQPYPPAAADDVDVARSVAGALGVRHVLVPQRRDRVAAEREKNRITHYCADEHVQFLPLRDHFTDRAFQVFDGLAGDVLSQSQRLDRGLHADFVEGRFERVADRVLGDSTVIEPALARLLTHGSAARFSRRLAISRIAAEAARHAAAPNPIGGFFFFSRMRREIALAPYALLDACPVSTPFLDRELVDLLLSLPFEMLADRTFHTGTLGRRYPAFAGLPFDSKRTGADDRAAVRRDAAAALRLTIASRSTIVHVPAVAARLMRAMATGASTHLWFLPRLVHLLDVEGRASEPSVARR